MEAAKAALQSHAEQLVALATQRREPRQSDHGGGWCQRSRGGFSLRCLHCGAHYHHVDRRGPNGRGHWWEPHGAVCGARRDELAALGIGLNTFIANLQAMVAAVHEASALVADRSQEAAAAVEEVGAAAEKWGVAAIEDTYV